MTTIINGSSPSITFSDSTTQSTAADKGPAFSAYDAVGQTISNNTWTKITVATEEFDTNNCFSSSTFTPNVAGYYLFTGNVNFQATGASGRSIVALYINGNIYKRGSGSAFASNTQQTQLSALAYMNGTTDYAEFYAFQTSGGNLSTGASSEGVYFQAALVRTA